MVAGWQNACIYRRAPTASPHSTAPLPIQHRRVALSPAEIVELKGLIASPRWSPDGRSIAVLATAGAHKETGAIQAGAREVGEIGSSAMTSRGSRPSRAAGGELKFVSPDGTFVYEYDWTPDGHGFVATAAQGNGDNNWWVAKLQAYTLDGAARVIVAPAFQMNFPRVAPDGRHVAFIGGLMSDFGSVGGDVYVVDIGWRSADRCHSRVSGQFHVARMAGKAARRGSRRGRRGGHGDRRSRCVHCHASPSASGHTRSRAMTGLHSIARVATRRSCLNRSTMLRASNTGRWATRNPSLTITTVSNRHTPRAMFIGRAMPSPSRAGCSARSMCRRARPIP